MTRQNIGVPDELFLLAESRRGLVLSIILRRNEHDCSHRLLQSRIPQINFTQHTLLQYIIDIFKIVHLNLVSD